MSLATLAQGISHAATTAATARTALARLVDEPALGREALGVVDGGGIAAVDRLIDATGPGALALREAWTAARSASEAFASSVGQLDGANQTHALRAASHAEAAADLLDSFVYTGGGGFTLDALHARASNLLEVAASAGDDVRITIPRAPRSWETLRQ